MISVRLLLGSLLLFVPSLPAQQPSAPPPTPDPITYLPADAESYRHFAVATKSMPNG